MEQNVNDNDNRKLYKEPLINLCSNKLHSDVNCSTLEERIDTSLVNNVQVTKDVLIRLRSIMC